MTQPLHTDGSFENEALENQDRSTKHPKLENEASKIENEAPKTRKRSTQNTRFRSWVLRFRVLGASFSKLPHTDDVNQCLHNKSGGHKVSNVNLFDFLFLLVDYRAKFCDFL